MATIHRGRSRPKLMRWKVGTTFKDYEFNEAKIVAWARAHITGAMTYDYIVFHLPGNRFSKQIELVAWFSKKDDMEAFEKEWA